jgi:hypothetical protein
MDHDSVLNPYLYQRLRRCYGAVKVADRGQARIATHLINPLTGRPVSHAAHAGEQYRVCCAFCNDLRFPRPENN